jgi:hypothetical protein
MSLKRLPLLMLFCLLALSVFALKPVSEKDFLTYPDISISEYEISVYGKMFTESEWWRSQPVISLKYEGEEKYLSAIERVLRRCGFVLGSGEEMDIFLQTIEDKFLYLNVSWNGKRFDNMKSLILIEDEIETELYDLFLNEFGDFKRKLPKLILIKSADEIYTDAELLYRGPEYSLFRTFEDVILIQTGDEELSVSLPFNPITFYDLSENQFQLYINSSESTGFLLDGVEYIAPIALEVESGVHKLEYAGEITYLYVIENMSTELDVGKLSAKIKIQVDTEASIRLYKGDIEVKNVIGKTLECETTAGDFRVFINKDGYTEYEELFTLEGGEYFQKQIHLKGEPGSLAFEMDLNGSYDDILANGYCYVLKGDKESLIIKRKGFEAYYLDEGVVALTANYLITDFTVYDLMLEPKLTFETPIVNAVETKRSLWLFLADKRISGIDTTLWNEFWIRVIDYLPLQIIQTAQYVAVYDVFSRVILIDSEYGYNELFNERLINIKGLTGIEKEDERVSVLLKGTDQKISWYIRRMKFDISHFDSRKDDDVFFHDGWFLQDGERLFETSSMPVAYLSDDELCVFISSDSVRGFYIKQKVFE